MGGARIRDQPFELSELASGGMAARGRQAIVAAPFVVMFGIGPLLQFLDQALFQEALDRAVKGAGAQPDLAIGPFGDVLQDGVAVPVGFGQGHQDVKRVARKVKRFHTRAAGSELRYSEHWMRRHAFRIG